MNIIRKLAAVFAVVALAAVLLPTGAAAHTESTWLPSSPQCTPDVPGRLHAVIARAADRAAAELVAYELNTDCLLDGGVPHLPFGDDMQRHIDTANNAADVRFVVIGGTKAVPADKLEAAGIADSELVRIAGSDRRGTLSSVLRFVEDPVRYERAQRNPNVGTSDGGGISNAQCGRGVKARDAGPVAHVTFDYRPPRGQTDPGGYNAFLVAYEDRNGKVISWTTTRMRLPDPDHADKDRRTWPVAQKAQLRTGEQPHFCRIVPIVR